MGEPVKLSLVGQLAIRTAFGDVARARAVLRTVMTEMGLDPNRDYRLLPDGSLELVEPAPLREVRDGNPEEGAATP